MGPRRVAGAGAVRWTSARSLSLSLSVSLARSLSPFLILSIFVSTLLGQLDLDLGGELALKAPFGAAANDDDDELANVGRAG